MHETSSQDIRSKLGRIHQAKATNTQSNKASYLRKNNSSTSVQGFFEKISDSIKKFTNNVVEKVKNSFKSIKSKVTEFFSALSPDNLKAKLKKTGEKIR